MPGNGNRRVLHGAVIAAMAVTAMVLSYRRGHEQAAVIAVLVVGLFAAYAARALLRSRFLYNREDDRSSPA
jgi:hypothetical protein